MLSYNHSNKIKGLINESYKPSHLNFSVNFTVFNTVNKDINFMLIGILQIIIGIALWCLAFSLGTAWIAFCFGSILIGILVLIFAPHLLLLPFAFIATPANGFLFLGWQNIRNVQNQTIDSDAVWDKSSENLSQISALIEEKKYNHKE